VLPSNARNIKNACTIEKHVVLGLQLFILGFC